MSNWIIHTNNGYVESSIGKSGTDEIFPTFTEDFYKATYGTLEETKRWAGEIISKSLCGVLYVKLIPLGDSEEMETN